MYELFTLNEGIFVLTNLLSFSQNNNSMRKVVTVL